MANKLWYTGFVVDGIWHAHDKSWEHNYIQNLIDLYCPDLFKVPEDINPDNFQHFLRIILAQYQNYNIDMSHLLDIGYIISDYFDDCFDELPSYSNDDRRKLTLYIFNNSLDNAFMWSLMPEDVPYIIECLDAPDNQVQFMYDKLKQYFDQFDAVKRANEERPRRCNIIKKQRLNALEKGDPLPIRPMGIELDMCYKDDLNNDKE